MAKQLSLEDELSLFVLLRSLVCFVVFPADDALAVLAADISDDVATGGHVALDSFIFVDVDDVVEKVGFAVLAAEVAANDIVVNREVCLALATTVDACRVEVYVISQSHVGWRFRRSRTFSPKRPR